MSKNVVDMTLRANMDVSQISSGVNQIQGILQKLNLPANVKKQFDQLLSTATSDLEKYQQKLNSGFKTKGDLTGLEKAGNALKSSIASLEKEWSKLQSMDISSIVKLDPSAQAEIKKLEEDFKRLGNELQTKVKPNLDNIKNQISQLTTASSKKAGANIAELLGAGQYEEAAAAMEKYIAQQQKAMNSFGEDKGKATREATLAIYEAINAELQKIIGHSDQYNQSAQGLNADRMKIFSEAIQKANINLQQGGTALQQASAGAQNYTSNMQQAAGKTVELSSDLDMLKSRVQYFFSLTNSVMLFRRILQDTIQTTKELDAAMTETAVVTDFSVADMWKDLPRYTATAKELGATIQGVYETMTLYYQQGLKTNEVFEVGTETLKMARIAGLDYAQATDFMTAALRGFNMEVNELNAQKVNDVYSELAAITAADTQEIATAMTKTASIASSANMEFETTAAFLSQIIETTRESAETAGTALKTVIARFTELKKDPSEIGEVDGEIVDANKIETALRTIDVALRDTSGQFRDLDDVFLDIAEKWDGLDTNTQRYIATMAAGSRQQSRFIAMMSDYSRTMELVGAANNSAGASQRQFDKTLESLDTKLNNLKNAWDQFTMGIANNTLIKAGIDALTGFLNLVNKLTEGLPGATKGIANLLLMIGGFSAGKKIFDAFTASTLTNVAAFTKGGTAAGQAYGTSFGAALKTEFGKTGDTISKLISKKTWIGAGRVKSAGAEDLANEVAKAKSELANTESRMNTILASGRNPKALDNIYKNQIKDIQNLQAIESKYLSATTSQRATFLALKESGLSTDKAAIALTKSLTAEDYKKLAIESLLITTGKAEEDLTEEEIKNTIALIKTKSAEQTVEKTGLLTRAGEVIMSAKSALAKKLEAAATDTSTAAKIRNTIATKIMNLSLAATVGWLIAIAAAAAIVVVGLIALVKWSKTQTLEYKMEKAAEATEKAKEAANNAKQAYDDLNSSIEEIGTKEKELENLTYGTLEWQRALLEVNQQVMDLIDKFPEMRNQLLNELQVNAEGKLTLTTKGYEMMQEKALNQYKNALAGQIVSSGNEAYLQKQQALSNYNNYNALVYKTDDQGQTQEASFGQKMAGAQMFNAATQQNASTFDLLGLIDLLSGNTEAITERAEQQLAQQQKGLQLYSSDKEMTTLSSAQKDEIYAKFLENGRMFESNTPALQEFANGMGIASESLLEFVPAMRERQQAEIEYGLAMRAQAKQLLLSTTSDNFKNKDNSRELADTFGQFYAEQQEDLIAEEAKKITDVGAYAKQMGLSGFIDQGSELKNLQKVYQELTGSTKEQVEDMFGESKEELKKAIAAIKVGKDWGQKVEGFAADLEEFGKGLTDEDLKNKINNLFGGADGTGFGFGELGNFKTKEGTRIDASSEEAKALEELYNSSSALQDQFETFADFLDWRNKQNEKGWELEKNTVKNLTTFGLMGQTGKGATNVSFTEGLDLGAVSGLSQKIIDVFATSGREAAIGLSDNIETITGSLSHEKADLFASALNGIDWTNKEEVEGFSEVIEDLGIYIDPTKGNIDQLEQEIIQLARATTKVSLENLVESIQNLNKIALDIKTGEIDNRTFSKDMVDTLVSTGAMEAKEFSFNIETGEYTYLGESTDRIVEAIREQTDALLGADEYEEKIKSGEVVGSLKEQGEFSEVASDDYNKKLDFIKAYNTAMSLDEDGKQILDDKGKPITPYSEDYLSKLGNTGDAAVQEVINSIYDKLINDFLSVETNQQKLAEANRQGGVVQAQVDNTSADLTQKIGELRENGTNISEEDQQKLETYTTALINQAEAAEVSQQKIDAYAKKLLELKNATDPKEIEKLTKEVGELEKELSNTIGFNKTNKALEETISSVIDLLNEYENLEDQTSQVQQVQEMVDAFDLDLEVDTSNYQDIYDYMLGIAQGSYEAYQGLMNLAMGEFGVKISGEGYFQPLDDAIDTSNQKFIDFINNMIENGAFVEETVSQEDVMNYIGYLQKIVDDEGNVTYEPITKETVVTSDITVVRPKAAGEIQTISNQGGGGSSYTPSSGGSGGGGGGSGGDSGSEEEPWENTFDKFYNINEDINELLDRRNELEADYSLLLQDEKATIDDYLKSYTDRIKSFKEEIALQEEMLRLRQQDQEDILSEYSHLSKYAWVEDGAVYIDYEAIDRVEDQELGEEIEEFVSKLEENDEAIQEASDAIQENTLAIEDLLDEWRDVAAGFEQRVFDAIVEEREKEIEKLEEAAQTLDDSNSELVDAIQKEINERRQQRENEETEKDLAEKERRLAYLQQDTSGAYDTEILQLEKDLKQQKEDYTDTLIDQKISELQEQNDEAAKQREKQIQIMQYQLKNDQETGVIASQVSKLLQEANSNEGWARVWKLLEKSEGFKGLTDTNKKVWEEETQREFKEAMAYLNGIHGGGIALALKGVAAVNTDYYDSIIGAYSSGDGTTVTPSGNGNPEGTGGGSTSLQVSQVEKDAKGIQYYKIGDKWYKSSDTSGLSNGSTTLKEGATPLNKSLMAYDGKTTTRINNLGTGATSLEAINNLKKKGSVETIDSVEYFKYGSNYYYVADIDTYSMATGKGVTHYAFIKEGASYFKKYKTGGLADYTGPAWLDGTKSKPELVLNQKETQNFLQLKDVLSSFMNQKSNMVDNSSSNGDTIYDISISVENLSNDYDVEQVANKVKQIISNDAAYRNSTMIQRLR